MVFCRAKMIVDDIKENTEAKAMGFIDKEAKVIRASVAMIGCIPKNSVIALAASAWKLGDRHHLKRYRANDCHARHCDLEAGSGYGVAPGLQTIPGMWFRNIH
jgi:hypothetical protein